MVTEREEEPETKRRYRMRVRKRILGSALAVLGVMVWAMSATLGLASNDHRDVSISHFEELSLGVIAGGAAVVGGVILLATAV
jgi:hypothetical protein